MSDASGHKFVVWGVAAVALAAAGAVGLQAVVARTAGARRAAAQASAALGERAELPGGAGAAPAPEPALSPRERAKLEESWIDSATYAPRSDRLDPATGERVGAFHGFGLQVDTEPAGARVTVAGEELGTAPLLATVACRPGDELVVRAERAGASATARTRCRADALVKLALTLRPAR